MAVDEWSIAAAEPERDGDACPTLSQITHPGQGVLGKTHFVACSAGVAANSSGSAWPIPDIVVSYIRKLAGSKQVSRSVRFLSPVPLWTVWLFVSHTEPQTRSATIEECTRGAVVACAVSCRHLHLHRPAEEPSGAEPHVRVRPAATSIEASINADFNQCSQCCED